MCRTNIKCNFFYRVLDSLESINKRLEENTNKLNTLQLNLDKLYWAPKNTNNHNLNSRTIIFIVIGLIVHAIVTWFIIRK